MGECAHFGENGGHDLEAYCTYAESYRETDVDQLWYLVGRRPTRSWLGLRCQMRGCHWSRCCSASAARNFGWKRRSARMSIQALAKSAKFVVSKASA